MMRLRLIALVFLITSCVSSVLQSTNSELPASEIQSPKPEISKEEVVRLFVDANEKYLEAAKLIAGRNNQEAAKRLEDAVLQYERILSAGFRHSQIYYNLGNTYYRKGELGKAIANYRRAQRLMPRNADLDANLKLVRNVIEDKELTHEPPGAVRKIFFWLFFLNQNELIVTTVFLYGVLMILLLLLIILRYYRLKKIILGFAAGLLIIVVSLGVKIYWEDGVSHGVIVSDKCHVRYGPGDEYEPKFEIHDGAECVIESEKDGWYRVYVYISIVQGTDPKMSSEERVDKEIRRGWLRKKDVDVI